MIVIENTIVSDELISEAFVCDLSRCKGACCVEGDLGAPLELAERNILENVYEEVKPYLTEEGIDAIEQQGKFVRDYEGDFSTPLVKESSACAYAVQESNGTWLCGIEKAWKAGKTEFRKPISCHLYPVRLANYQDYTAVNYHEWDICSAACSLGASLKVPVYQFVKEALIRKFGEAWYDTLEATVRHMGEKPSEK